MIEPVEEQEYSSRPEKRTPEQFEFIKMRIDGSVAGANQDQNSFMLDGGNNSSDMDGTQNTYTPSFAGDPSGGLVGQVTGTAGTMLDVAMASS